MNTRTLQTVFSRMLVAVVLLWWTGHAVAAQPAPYPPSTVVKNISWDTGSAVQMAPDSDLWPVTWAGDGHLYTSWGDGGGFGGSNSNGRVSMGIARLEGMRSNYNEEIFV